MFFLRVRAGKKRSVSERDRLIARKVTVFSMAAPTVRGKHGADGMKVDPCALGRWLEGRRQ